MLGQPASSQTVCSPPGGPGLQLGVLRPHPGPGPDPRRLALDRGLGVADLQPEQPAALGCHRHDGQATPRRVAAWTCGSSPNPSRARATTTSCASPGPRRPPATTRSSAATTTWRWARRRRPGPTDAWVTLAGLARETSRIRLGTLVTSATFRLPGPLAISVAQVDAMCGGGSSSGSGRAGSRPSTRRTASRSRGWASGSTGWRSSWRSSPGSGRRAGGAVLLRGHALRAGGLARPAEAGPAAAPAGDRRRVGREADARARRAVRGEFNVPFAVEETSPRTSAGVRACRAIGRDPAEPCARWPTPSPSAGTRPSTGQRALTISRDPDDMRVNGLAGTVAEVVDRLGQYGEKPVSRGCTCSPWTWPTSTTSSWSPPRWHPSCADPGASKPPSCPGARVGVA